MNLEELTALAIEALEDIKAENIVQLDVSNITPLTDRMIIATGRTGRQVKALANSVVMNAKHAGHQPKGVEGDTGDCEWVLVDLNDIVVHIMQPNARMFYQLEKLWDTAAAEAAEQEHPLDVEEVAQSPHDEGLLD